MMNNIEIQNFTYSVLDILNAGIAKLLNLMTICANQVVMLLVSIGLFVLRQVFTKLMLGDKIAFYQ